MDTRQLICFLKIVEMRSISRAAISLGISQPSLSQQLLRLEDELGVKLFHRGARGVTVTEAGRLFEDHARQLLQRSKHAQESLRQLSASATGRVILAAPPSVVQLLAVPLFETFAERAPGVSLRMTEAFTQTTFSWLERGKVDLGVVYDLGPRPSLLFRPLVSEELFLVGPPGAFDDEQIPAESLARYDLLLPGTPHALRQLLEREAVRREITLNVTHDVDSLGALTALVARGHGHTILPRAAVEKDVSAGRLVLCRIGDGAFQRKLCMARNTARTLTHASVVAEDLNAKVMLELIQRGIWDASPCEELR